MLSASLINWMERRKKVYEARQNRIETICKKYNVTTTSSEDQVEDLINRFLHNETASGKLRTGSLCQLSLLVISG